MWVKYIMEFTNYVWDFGLLGNRNHYGSLVFRKDGRIAGYVSQNEVYWELTGRELVIKNFMGRPTSIFNMSDYGNELWVGDLVEDSAGRKHVLSKRNDPIHTNLVGKIEKFAEEGRFYLSHLKKRGGVYKEGDSISVYPNAVVEASATLPKGCIYRMGAFSYQSGACNANLSVGRYTSIAMRFKAFGPAHPLDWLTSNPIAYAKHHQSLNNDVGLKNPPKTKYFKEKSADIVTVIGNDVWIGEDVLFKPGIRIGDGAVVASRSILTKDVEPYSIVGGSPAKFIKMRFDNATVQRLQSLQWWDIDLSGAEFDWSDVHGAIKYLEERRNFLGNFNIQKSNIAVEILSNLVY